MVFCPNCGAEMPFEDAQFCMKCGQKVNAQPKESPAKAPPAPQAAPSGEQAVPPVPQAAPSGEQAVPPPPQAAPSGEQPDKDKDNNILALIAEAQAGAAKKRAEDAAPPAGAVQAPAAAAQATDVFELPVLTQTPGPDFLPPEAPGTPLPAPPQQTVPPPPPGAPSLFDATGTLNKQPSPPTQIFNAGAPRPTPQQAKTQAPPPQPVYPQNRPPVARPSTPLPPPVPPAAPPAFGQPGVRPQVQTAQGAFPAQRGGGQPTMFGGEAPRQSYPAPRPAPPPVQLPREQRPRRSGGSVALRIIISFVIFIVVLAGVTVGMLYFLNRPGATIDDFTAALQEGNTSKVRQMALLSGMEASAADWQALCDAFQTEEEISALKAQLNELVSNPGAMGQPYEAIGLYSEPVLSFLPFIQKYTVTIQAVELMSPAPQSQLYLNDKVYPTSGIGESVMYKEILPGQYQCRVVAPGQDPSQVAAITVSMFKVGSMSGGTGSGPNALDDTLLRATITVENCISDAAQLFVNDAPVAVTIVDGKAGIPGVALGSTIRIVATVDGAQQTASVVFQNPGETTLRFGAYTPLAPVENPPPDSSGSASGSDSSSSLPEGTPQLSAAEIDTVMADYYQSYLECINAQSVDGLRRTTESNRTAMAARIELPGNVANLFRYTSVKCDADSIKYTTASGTTAIEFTMTGRYSYTPRENGGTYTDGSTRQSVQLVYQNGGWLVNKFDYLE